jgi:hypothetical protein
MMENEWRYYERLPERDLKQLLTLQVNHRIYSPYELMELLSNAGWDHIKSYGNLQKLEPLSTDSFKMTLVSNVGR